MDLPLITLNRIEIADADALFSHIDTHRMYLRAWLPWLDYAKTVVDTTAFIDQCQKEMLQNKSYVATVRFGANIVGVISLNRIDLVNKVASIGYWLAGDYQGRGIISRALQQLCHYSFHELALNRLEIYCAVENKPSRAVAERAGFSYEGVLKQREWLYDHYVDHALYALLKPDWIARQNALTQDQ